VPKLKTNKSASKRFHITGSGKIMRTRGGKSHLRRNKRPSVTRAYAEMAAVDSTDTKKVKRLLPYGL
jgi:large subunit ribosomal protein L35